MGKLSHTDSQGNAKMVDVGDKPLSQRFAIARGVVRVAPNTLQLITKGGHRKGDVLSVARIAGIQAAKNCSQLIPLCHQLMLSKVDVNFELDPEHSLVKIVAECKVKGQTGVEMEALTAVSVAALTIYDMCKAVDKDMMIEGVCLMQKSGGKSGHYQRSENN